MCLHDDVIASLWSLLPEGDSGRLSVPILMESLMLLEPFELTCMILRKMLGLSKPVFNCEPLFEARELLLVGKLLLVRK